ncbi:MAG: galactose mutarotase [Eubacterium sp.]|nr:galactose mutarotase [Eubacterium sp.]
MKKEKFGNLKDGREVYLYTLENKNGVKVTISEFGATITSLIVPDKNGKYEDVVLGYDILEPYFTNIENFGATIGRNANRIEGARFKLADKAVELSQNEGKNNLHTDLDNGFHKKLWESVANEEENSVTMSYLSPNGENGFPGNLDMKVTFSLTDENEVVIFYEGSADQKTVINCTNHSYFNLAGAGNGDVLNHYLKIFSEEYNPVKEDSVPTGEKAFVRGTPFDFSDFRRIGDDIDSKDGQLKITGGYDHNFIIKEPGGLIAVAEEKMSGRRMEVYSSLPGLQLYTGNYIRDGIKGKDGKIYNRRGGLCLETQFVPNSVNMEGFKKPIYEAGEKYEYKVVYKFVNQP